MRGSESKISWMDCQGTTIFTITWSIKPRKHLIEGPDEQALWEANHHYFAAPLESNQHKLPRGAIIPEKLSWFWRNIEADGCSDWRPSSMVRRQAVIIFAEMACASDSLQGNRITSHLSFANGLNDQIFEEWLRRIAQSFPWCASVWKFAGIRVQSACLFLGNRVEECRGGKD